MSTMSSDNSSQDSTAETTQPDETMPEESAATELDTFVSSLKEMLDAEDGLTVTTSDEDSSKDGIYPAFYKPVGYDYFAYPAESLALYVVSDDDQATITTIGEHLVGLGLEKDETSESIYSSDSLMCNVLASGTTGATYVSITCADKASHEAVAEAAKPFYEAFAKSDTYSADSSYVLYLPVVTDEEGKESSDGTMATMDIGTIGAGTTTAEFTKVDGTWTYNSETENTETES